MKCPTCGKDNPSGIKFCGECGSKLVMLCPFCREPVYANAEFCLNCGEYLVNAVEPTVTEPTSESAHAMDSGKMVSPAYYMGSVMVSAEIMRELDYYMNQGRIIDGLRVVRTATDWGLKEAMAWIEKYEPNNWEAYAHPSHQASSISTSSAYYIGSTPVSENTMQEIKFLITRNRKLDAIKLVREATGMGLPEAKNWVDNYNTNISSYIRTVSTDTYTPTQTNNNIYNVGGAMVSKDTFEQIQVATKQGKKLDAIKILREANNLGLKEAKDCIEHFMQYGT